MPAIELFPGCTMVTMESPDDVATLHCELADMIGEPVRVYGPGALASFREEGETAAYYDMVAGDRRPCPYDATESDWTREAAAAWTQGYETIAGPTPRTLADINTYQEIDFIPAYVAPQWTDAGISNHDVLKYAGKKAPPPIGAEIVITINGHGPARVAGYFVQDGFLGVRVVQDVPRPEYVKQNGGNVPGHVFGTEFASAAVKPFDGTGTAYDSVQWDDTIRTGDVLLVESESVVGLAWAWPIAVTVESGHFHTARADDVADVDGLLSDAGIHPMQVKAAVGVAMAHGFKVRPEFERFKDARFHAHALISMMAQDAMAVGPDRYVSVMGVRASYSPDKGGVVWAQPGPGDTYARDAAAAYLLSLLSK